MSSREDVRRAALRCIASSRTGGSFALHEYSLYATVRKEVPGDWPTDLFMQVMWQLLSEGLVFIDYYQREPGNWTWWLTERGQQSVASGTYDPADPGGYLKRLAAIPGLDSRIPVYVREALLTFESGCYLACAVMLGVASEAAFDDLVGAFERWSGLTVTEAERFKQALEGRQYAARFDEFRKRLDPKKPQLPADLSDGLEIILNGVLDLLRVNRNDAGHPTGRQIDERTAYTSLQLLERYLERLYALKAFFEANVRP